MKGHTFNTANLPFFLIYFNYTRDTAEFEAAEFDSYSRHFGVIFVFRQTKSQFAHGEALART